MSRPRCVPQRLAGLGRRNLRELAAHIDPPLFLAHLRAAIGSPVQDANCNPVSRRRWPLVHNDFLADFHLLGRNLILAIDPERFADMHGSGGTDVVSHLSLTFGLGEPIGALEQTVGPIEGHGAVAQRCRRGPGQCRRRHAGVGCGTVGRMRSLFASAGVDAVRRLYPDNPRFQRPTEDDPLIVPEPFSDLPGGWQGIPERTALTVRRGGVLEQRAFVPRSDHPGGLGPERAGAGDG